VVGAEEAEAVTGVALAAVVGRAAEAVMAVGLVVAEQVAEELAGLPAERVA
jgi:hypothetical protein